MQQEQKGIEHWVNVLSFAELPVLKHTARELATMREDQNRLSARGVAQVIAIDPMMTVKVLRYLQNHKHRSQMSEVILVEQALIMMGVEAFFDKIPPQPWVQDVLAGHNDALVQLLHIIHRSHRASEYAYEWAVHMSDLHFEEVRIAALLHDLSEMLMWCFAPQEMMQIRDMQIADKTLRSRAAQEEVLGFNLFDLQQHLVKAWSLPELLLTLMDDECSSQQRVRNVILAVNLARHSANGWDDAALPDDYKDISDLLRIKPEQVMVMIGVNAGIMCDSTGLHSHNEE